LFVYQDKAFYSCHDGYEYQTRNPASNTTCEADGYWEPASLDTCQPVSCGPPIQSEHIVLVGDVYTFNSTVLYDCDSGYDLVGPSSRVCLSNKYVLQSFVYDEVSSEANTES